jgi:hypothetical protein
MIFHHVTVQKHEQLQRYAAFMEPCFNSESDP